MEYKNVQHYSRSTDEGPGIAERVIRTIRNLLKKQVFEKGSASCITEVPSVNKQYNNTNHHSIKMTPVHAGKKVNEKIVFDKLEDRELDKN